MNEIKKIENNKYVSKFRRYLFKIIDIIKSEEMKILPGNIAFFLILSVVPMITLIGFIGSNFSSSLNELIEFLEPTLPKSVTDILLPFLQNAADHKVNIVIYLIIGFVMASNGTHSIIIASNTLYDVENKSYLFRRIKAFILIIMLMILFTFILIGLAFNNIIYNLLVKYEILTFNKTLVTIFNLLKWPGAFFVIFFVIRLLYTMSVDKRISSKYITKGAIFTTTGWVILTFIYSIYANNYARYDVIYGSLSGLIILMLWVYLLSYVLVIGIAINSGIYQNLVKKGKIKNLE